MKELIRELKTRYPDRYVIFDTPPMLPFADAQVLKNAVDATLFVVRERQAKIQHVKKILNDLRDANLLGVVYNDIQSYTANNPYYYY
jgi:Mrp family chromosome partitioning ATPase